MSARVLFVPGLGLGAEAWHPTLTAMGGTDGEVALLPAFGARPDPEVDLHPTALARLLTDRG